MGGWLEGRIGWCAVLEMGAFDTCSQVTLPSYRQVVSKIMVSNKMATEVTVNEQVAEAKEPLSPATPGAAPTDELELGGGISAPPSPGPEGSEGAETKPEEGAKEGGDAKPMSMGAAALVASATAKLKKSRGNVGFGFGI